jgi:hypothetical protein
MKVNYKHLGIYLLAGIASGSAGTFFLLEISFGRAITDYIPSIILGIVILIVGRYVSDTQLRSGWISSAIVVAACVVGWHFALTYGIDYATINWETCTLFCSPERIVSGGIGGICVGIGLALAWKLSRVGVVVAITTVAGVLGGTIVSNPVGEQLFFLIWQSILFLGIGLALQIDVRKLSV